MCVKDSSIFWYHYTPNTTTINTTTTTISGKLLLELTDHSKPVTDLAFAPDGSLRLSSASRDGTIKVRIVRIVKIVKINSNS